MTKLRNDGRESDDEGPSGAIAMQPGSARSSNHRIVSIFKVLPRSHVTNIRSFRVKLLAATGKVFLGSTVDG